MDEDFNHFSVADFTGFFCRTLFKWCNFGEEECAIFDRKIGEKEKAFYRGGWRRNSNF